MIEALRGLGYTTASAIADIIDNSISAGAREIELEFAWHGDASVISILDDGHGMDEDELDLAMRMGEKNPLDVRKPEDLGRFGIGLKTASFSQCRRLTVASRRDGGTVNCLRWDLDVIAASPDDSWILLEGPDEASMDLIDPVRSRPTATLVLWEVLDRIVTPGFSEQDFLDLVDVVEKHLAMVFHEYLEAPHARVRFSINGQPITSWDPFLVYHPSTWSSPIVELQTEWGRVEVQSHVLPHKDRLDKNEFECAAGPDGWTAQQGFYVYRNERLIVAGSWLGLGQGRSWTKEEAHRLARIRLNIPNLADEGWKIDIRKSTAKPPVQVRPTLTRLAEDARRRARQVFAHRGRATRFGGSQPIVQAWTSEHFGGGMRYQIDREHPAVKPVVDDAGPLHLQIEAMIRIIEETVPVQRIWLDTSEGREPPRTGFSGGSSREVKAILDVMYRNLVVLKGVSPELARDQLLHTEPFHDYPDLVASLPDNLPEAE